MEIAGRHRRPRRVGRDDTGRNLAVWLIDPNPTHAAAAAAFVSTTATYTTHTTGLPGWVVMPAPATSWVGSSARCCSAGCRTLIVAPSSPASLAGIIIISRAVAAATSSSVGGQKKVTIGCDRKSLEQNGATGATTGATTTGGLASTIARHRDAAATLQGDGPPS